MALAQRRTSGSTQKQIQTCAASAYSQQARTAALIRLPKNAKKCGRNCPRKSSSYAIVVRGPFLQELLASSFSSIQCCRAPRQVLHAMPRECDPSSSVGLGGEPGIENLTPRHQMSMKGAPILTISFLLFQLFHCNPPPLGATTRAAGFGFSHAKTGPFSIPPSNDPMGSGAAMCRNPITHPGMPLTILPSPCDSHHDQ